MTLHLEINHIDSSLTNYILVVEGSEAGILCSQDHKINGFKVSCNRYNTLNLYFYEKAFESIQSSEQLKKGESSFSACRFVQENKRNEKLYNNSAIEVHLIAFDLKGKEIGNFVVSVHYFPDLLFKGEKFGNFQTLPVVDPYPIYNGPKVATKNLFSFCDADKQEAQYSFLEGTYRDGQ